ncbi:hypothetical protein HK101_004440, partial [Irineochytrium annulatum]
PSKTTIKSLVEGGLLIWIRIMIADLPADLWPTIIRLAARTLSELARLSALSRATRVGWSVAERHRFLTINVTDSRPAIDRLAAEPAVLRNPRLFPNLPNLLSLFFSSSSGGGGPQPGWCGFQGHDTCNDCLLIKICDEEDDAWVRACLERWPFEPSGGILNATRLPLFNATFGVGGMPPPAPVPHLPPTGSPRFQDTHLSRAALVLLKRGRLDLLRKLVGDRVGPNWKVTLSLGMTTMMHEASDPLPILKELVGASFWDPDADDRCWLFIATAVSRGLLDVVRFLGTYADDDGRLTIYNTINKECLNVDAVAALTEIGARITQEQFIDVLTQRYKVLPQRIQDEPILAALLESLELVSLPNNWTWFTAWKLIERPTLRAQLIERGVIPPNTIDLCLRSCANAVYDLDRKAATVLAQRCLDLGASRAGALTYAAEIGDCELMRVVLATDAEESKDPGLVMAVVRSVRLSLAMCELVLDAGYDVPAKEAIAVVAQSDSGFLPGDSRLQVLRMMLDAGLRDRDAILADPGTLSRVFEIIMRREMRVVDFSAWGTDRETSKKEEMTLPQVGALLEFGFRPSAEDVALAKSLG